MTTARITPADELDNLRAENARQLNVMRSAFESAKKYRARAEAAEATIAVNLMSTRIALAIKDAEIARLQARLQGGN